MLQTLHIENVALIDKAELNFNSKLNVISGETGAGKSIMLDSLSFVFGGRADKSLIRTGAKSMKVDAVFNNISRIQKEYIYTNFAIQCDGEVFVSRELDINGKNTCKINGELVPVAVVKKICSMLADIHGQSEHLAILDNDYQLKIIDLFSKTNENVLAELNEKIENLKLVEQSIKSLGGSETEKQNLIDLYSFQIKEIEDADLKETELDELILEKKEMNQFEKINNSLKVFYTFSAQNEFGESATELLNQAKKSLTQISDINENYKQLYERISSAILEIQDINDTVDTYLNNNEFNEERFNYVDNRIDFLKSLYRKYGGNYESLIQYYKQISTKLDNLINGAEKYKQLTQEKENLLDEIDLIQAKLSKERKKSAEILKQKMQQELITLGMPNARIDIEFSRIQERYSLTGFDRVEYMFSSNLGFELKPLNKVVSGGEMSRVMLAYKIVVSSVDSIHTIVFDEIDSGLSGHIATIVAEYMARLSEAKQIIAVSHLPQICAMADQNIKVEKFSDLVTTHTKSTILEGEMLYLEIARLMGATEDNKGIEIGKALKLRSEEYKKQKKNGWTILFWFKINIKN